MSDTRTILVVDDEPGMRAALSEVLARGGFAVEQATSGGPRKGSTMRVVLPLTITDQKQHERQNQTRREAA